MNLPMNPHFSSSCSLPLIPLPIIIVDPRGITPHVPPRNWHDYTPDWPTEIIAYLEDERV